MVSNEAQVCIDACNRCTSAANACLARHVGEEPMKACLLLCLDCTDLCSACTQMLARGSEFGNRVCAVCAELCERCAVECEKFESRECQDCADACRKCAEECRQMGARKAA